MFLTPARELYRYRQLLYNLVSRDLRVRYKRSFLGVLWAFIDPLFMMILFTAVFSFVFRIEVPNYPVFVLTGLIVWGFFQSGVDYSVNSVTGSANLIKKIHFPREILPISLVVGRFVHLLISFTVLVPFLLLFSIPFELPLLALPVIIAIQLALVTGLALLASALSTLYEDIGFIVSFALRALLYASPVLYPVSMVPESVRPLYLLNPMAALIQSYRLVILEQAWPDPSVLAIASATSFLVFVLGLTVFRRVEWRFAEVL